MRLIDFEPCDDIDRFPLKLTLVTDHTGEVRHVYVDAPRTLGSEEHNEEMDLLRVYFPKADIRFLCGYTVGHVLALPESTQFLTGVLAESTDPALVD